MEKLDLSKKSLRKFGMVMSGACALIAALLFIKHRQLNLPVVFISVAFFACALFAWMALKPIYIVWMKLASVLSWVNTRLLLVIIFYLVFSPLGIVMRLFGIDLLERKMDKKANSYWKKKEAVFGGYERQF